MMVHKYDTERAVGLLRQYQDSLTSPEEQPLKTSVGKVSAIFGSQLFQALLGALRRLKEALSVKKVSGNAAQVCNCFVFTITESQRLLNDIQECYEVTLQLNTSQRALKEDGTKDVCEKPEEEEEEGVSRVRVTSRRSQKVERVSALVSRSHIDAPKESTSSGDTAGHADHVGWRSRREDSSSERVVPGKLKKRAGRVLLLPLEGDGHSSFTDHTLTFHPFHSIGQRAMPI